MVDYLYALASIGYVFWIARNVMYWGNLFQANAYSFPRVKTYLLKSPNGRNTLFSPISLLKWGMIFLYPFIIFHENVSNAYHVGITLLYGYEIIIVIKEAYLGQLLKREIMTVKTIVIIIGSFLIGILLFLIPPLDKFLWLVLLDRAVVVFIGIAILLFSLPEEFYLDYRMLQAAERLKERKKLRTIMFIGGEETVFMKQAADTVLKENFQVIATGRHADKKAILNSVQRISDSTDVFLIQATQLTRIELEQLLILLKPEWLIITSLSPFIDNEEKRQEELLALSDTFTQVFKHTTSILVNGDTSELRKMFKGKTKRVSFFSSPNYKQPGDSSPHQVQLFKNKTVFSLPVGATNTVYELPFVSAGSPVMVVPLIMLLQGLSVTPARIKQTIREVKSRTLYAHYTVGGITLVMHSGISEDRDLQTFSSYISIFKGKKILILDSAVLTDIPLREIDYLARNLATVYSFVFLLPSPTAELLKEALDRVRQSVYVQVSPQETITRSLRSLMEKGDIGLFYGPGTQTIAQNYLMKKRKEKLH